MKNKFYIELDYGDLLSNDTALGNRLMCWEAIYTYIENQNLINDFEFVLLSDRWKEKKYINLKNTTFENTIPNDVIKVTKMDVDNNHPIEKGNDYYYRGVLPRGSFDRSKTNERVSLRDSKISEKLNKIKKEKTLIAIHIRKGNGIIGSVYSNNNDDGYPDFTWEYYNSLIRIIKNIMRNKDYNLYIGSDLPIDILKENLDGEYLTRLDILDNQKEIELRENEIIQQISFEKSNMCDWIGFYYSDIIFTNEFSTFSLTAAKSNENLILSMFQWSHEWKPMIKEYLSKQKNQLYKN